MPNRPHKNPLVEHMTGRQYIYICYIPSMRDVAGIQARPLRAHSAQGEGLYTVQHSEWEDISNLFPVAMWLPGYQ